ncbi:TBC1 domain family member 15 isoform X2 [Alligator mississippiensis]|uniref:TBC1 domain family member 15 n=1 Tax=Alligator mississippiensis TaxID=8496 RepID=A0A151PFQ9_ALLMI|nr:TBC1 domain family member 15 isoform X2 [Alligator mississippiensis]KYO47774.1 TBC1 domain family member 17 isoform B [Alligator mississippiensis]
MAAPAGGKVVYEQEGVFIHSSCGKNDDQDNLISGVLHVLEKEAEVIVDWRPLDDTLDSCTILYAGKDSSSVVEWTQTPKEKSLRGSEHQNSYEAEWDMVNTVSFKKKPHSNGDATVHANGESKWSFLFSLTDLKSVKQNKEGMGWSYLVFCLKDDIILPALHFHHGDSKLLIKCLEKYVVLCESPQDKRILLVNCQNKSLSQSFENLLDEPSYGLLQKLKRDPYTATMGRFSKVTNYIFDSFRLSDQSTQRRPPSEMVDFLSDAIPGLKINQQEEPGFEVITRIYLGKRPEVNRREPVSVEEWTKNMDSEGRLIHVDSIKQMIFKGGLCHALRKEVWKFLLGYFPWHGTREERTNLQKRKTDEYFRMKLQWKSVSEEQEKRNSRLRDYRSLIEKDVNRTDRTNKFYEGQDNPGLILLHDILMTYCMYDFDLGYVQGMSDLLSPVLYVMENEVDAFWCFVSYMDQMHQNFEEQMQGMKTQLIHLSTLLRLLDSGFCNYLESQDSGYLYFCFRWLLIRFKREFSFQDILRLWEVMWTELPCQNFHLLICCAILESEKQQIMDKHYGFNEILKHVNELSMKIDVEDILCKAEAISMQMMSCKELPQAVCEILGMENSSATTPDSDTGEEEGDVMSHSKSTYQNISMPQTAANGKKDNAQQMAEVHRLTPA